MWEIYFDGGLNLEKTLLIFLRNQTKFYVSQSIRINTDRI